MAEGDLIALKAGDKVSGKYRLIRKIAEGGGGVVWETTAPGKTPLAVKFLKWDLLRDRKKQTERFKNEFSILKSLSHPNIARIYDFGVDGDSGLYFFTTELFTKGSLTTFVGGKIEAIEELLVQSLRALEYLRSNGLLHLDIKPQNLLLRKDGKHPELALIDFGLAAFRAPGKPGGTANYMAPEIAARRLASKDQLALLPEPDHRSDLYSLGVTFYHCLTGKQPFKAMAPTKSASESLGETLQRHLDFSPPPPSSVRKDVPEYLDKFIMKLMAKFPDDRYPSAIVALQALQFRSPRKGSPEDARTLLSYLPKMGKLIGRRKELSAIEDVLNAIAAGRPHATTVLCIAGRRGAGKTRLLKAANALAQKMEMETLYFDRHEPLRAAEVADAIEVKGQAKPPSTAVLIDDIERYIRNGGECEGHELVRTLVRHARLKMRMPEGCGRRLALVLALNTDKMKLDRAFLELDLDDSACHTVQLANFTTAEVGEYLTALLGWPPDPSVVEQLKRCTGGNPALMTGHLEQMIAKGRLFSLAGRPDPKTLKTLGLDLLRLPAPPAFETLTGKELCSLSKEARGLALIIACFGRPAGAEELNIVAGGKQGSGLLELVEAGIVKRGASDDGRFDFSNPLAARVVLKMAGQKESSRLHDRITKYLKGAGAPSKEEQDIHIAYGGGEKASRVAAFERLIESFTRAGSHQDAILHLEALLMLVHGSSWRKTAVVLEKLGTEYEDLRQDKEAGKCYAKLAGLKAPKKDALSLLALSHELQGRLALKRRLLKDARRHFGEALKHVDGRNPPGAARLRLKNYLAGCSLRAGLVEEAAEIFSETAKLARALNAREHASVANNELGEALLMKGDAKRALKVLAKELEEALRAKRNSDATKRHYLIANALRHHTFGRLREARTHYIEALKLAKAMRLVRLQVQILNGLGNLELKLTRPAKALGNYREALRLAQQVEGQTTSAEIMIGMGLAAAQMRDPGNIIEYLEAALEYSSGPKGAEAGLIRRYHPAIFVSLGDAYYQKRDFEKAERYLKKALELDRKHPLPPDLRYSLYGTLVEILCERGDVKSATGHMGKLEALTKLFPQAGEHFKRLSKRLSFPPF